MRQRKKCKLQQRFNVTGQVGLAPFRLIEAPQSASRSLGP